jgi:hypothetical protein
MASALANGAEESDLIEIRAAEIGYGGVYRSGYWTPVRLTLASRRAASGRLEILASDGDGVPIRYASLPSEQTSLSLAPGQESKHVFLVKSGPEQSRLSVRLVDPQSEAVLWQSGLPGDVPRPISASWEIVLSLGGVDASRAVSMVRRPESQRLMHAVLRDPRQAPEQWWGWEGVETIVVNLGAAAPTQSMSAVQWQALADWVRIGGGRLILSGAAERLATPSELAPLLPGTLAGSGPLRDPSELERLTGQSLVLPTDPAARPPVALWENVQGKVELYDRGISGAVPLAVRASRGFGEVIFLGLDLDHPALARWAGRDVWLAAAIERRREGAAASPPPHAAARLGYDDLVGQLRVALDRFPEVTVVNFTTVFVLMLIYLALVGPLEFLILERLRLPRWITWLIFPAVAGLFCAVGWYFQQGAHGQSVRVSRAEVIDVDQESQLVRATDWLHIYSPAPQRFDLSLKVDRRPLALADAPQGWLTWQGLPGNGLGGLAANQFVSASLPAYVVKQPPQGGIEGLPIQAASSKSLAARWWSRIALAQSSSLHVNDFGLLEGELVNPLPVDLSEALLMYDEWMYRLREVSAGQRVRVADFDPLNLEARLQQRRVAGAKDVASPWERDSTDVPRILQMLMFHEAARGSTYTGLAHRYQTFLDLSPHLKNGRAILVGRIRAPMAELISDSEPIAAAPPSEGSVWLRLVLPVSPKPAGR